MVDRVVRIRDGAQGGDEMWNWFIESAGFGGMDPAHCDPSFLASFLEQADPAFLASGGMAAPAGGQDAFNIAVAQVKTIQKTDRGRAMWRQFIDNLGGGKRDPASRSLADLQAFMESADPSAKAGGAILRTLSPGGTRMGMAGAGNFHSKAVARVKAVQKMPDGFDMWSAFIDNLGGGKRDPAVRSIEELEAFLANADPCGETSQAAEAMGSSICFLGGIGSNLAGGQPQSLAVARVKVVQKMEGGRDMWRAFIANSGGDKKDPADRTEEELEAFLAEADPSSSTMAAGMEMQSSPGSAMGGSTARGRRDLGMGGMPQTLQQAVAMVKQVQKTDSGRDIWQNFITQNGGGKRDPSLRSLVELQLFLQETDPGLGVPMDGMGMMGIPMGPSTPSTAKYLPHSVEHAQSIARVKAIQKMEGGQDQWVAFCTANDMSKRDPAANPRNVLEAFIFQTDPEGSTSHVEAHVDENQILVGQIKRGQRMSDEFKAAWGQYCATMGNDVRDPTGHSAESLRSFLAMAPDVVTHEEDPQHQAFAKEIKQGQRNSEEFKKKWWAFCASNGSQSHDPAKHDTSFLALFLNQYGKASTKSFGEQLRYAPY